MELDALVAERVREFAAAILHGDDEHREWLAAAAEAFVAGRQLPPPNGKGRAEAAEALLEAERSARVRLEEALQNAAQQADAKGSDLRNDDATRRGAVYAAYLIRSALSHSSSKGESRE